MEGENSEVSREWDGPCGIAIAWKPADQEPERLCGRSACGGRSLGGERGDFRRGMRSFMLNHARRPSGKGFAGDWSAGIVGSGRLCGGKSRDREGADRRKKGILGKLGARSDLDVQISGGEGGKCGAKQVLRVENRSSAVENSSPDPK